MYNTGFTALKSAPVCRAHTRITNPEPFACKKSGNRINSTDRVHLWVFCGTSTSRFFPLFSIFASSPLYHSNTTDSYMSTGFTAQKCAPVENGTSRRINSTGGCTCKKFCTTADCFSFFPMYYSFFFQSYKSTKLCNEGLQDLTAREACTCNVILLYV